MPIIKDKKEAIENLKEVESLLKTGTLNDIVT
jgi:hypothetical protein